MENGVAVEKPKSEVAVIFDRITSGLQAFEEKKESLLALVAETKDLTVSDINDRPTIVKVIEGRKKLKKERVSIEKDGKALREPLTAVNRQISAKESELVAITEPEEKRLEGIEEWVENEKERIKQEEIAAAKARIQSRIDRLAAYNQTIDIAYIESASDETFEKVLDRAKIEHEKELAEQEAERKREQERQEQAEKDRKELQLLREKQAEADRIIRERQEEAERKEREEKEAAEKLRNELMEKRVVQLRELGVVASLTERAFIGWGIHMDVERFNKALDGELDWDEMMRDVVAVVNDRKEKDRLKKEQEQQRLVKEAEDRTRGEERQRMLKKYSIPGKDPDYFIEDRIITGQRDEENWAALLESAIGRWEVEEESKKQIKREAELAESSDKEKYEQVIKHLKDFPKVEMKSPAYKKKLAIIKDFIADL